MSSSSYLSSPTLDILIPSLLHGHHSGTDDNDPDDSNKRPPRKLPSRCPASLITKLGLSLRLIVTSPFRLLSRIKRFLSRWLGQSLEYWFFRNIYIPEENMSNYPLISDPLSNLWTSSHLVYDKPSGKWKDEFRKRGSFGLMSKRYLAICLKIQQLTFWRTIKIMCKGQEWLMILDFGINVSRGLSDPVGAWFFEKLVSEAHHAFGGEVDMRRLFWFAGAIAGLDILDTLILRLQTHINKLQKSHSRLTMDAELLNVDFSLEAVSRNDPWTRDIMYSAKDLAFDRTFINNIDPLIRDLIGLFGQIYLLTGIIRSLRKVLPLRIATLLVAAPAAISALSSIAISASQPIWIPNKDGTEISYIRNLPDIARGEFGLYGLKDWALEEWKRLSARMEGGRSEDQNFKPPVVRSCILSLIQSMSKTSGYILPALASRVATGKISFGVAFAASTGGTKILGHYHSIQRVTHQILAATTVQAAFWAAIDAAKTDRWNKKVGWYWVGGEEEAIEFEDIRDPKGGLKIEIKDLSFTFPNSAAPTLHDINLTLEAGETLAVVGVNGGGKSTLAKVIIGMLDHQQGTFLLNGVSTKKLHVQQFHSRTACLFQNFSEYPFSIRKNVGFGDVSRLDDREGMREAIKQGGAGEILKKVGWHCRFDPYSELASDSEGSDSDFEDEDIMPEEDGESEEEEKEEDEWDYYQQDADWTVKLLGGVGDKRPSTTVRPERKRRHRSRIEPSGGQWQRIALARTFFRSERADLIVYDEPSSALDPRAEHELFKRIRALSKKRKTTIYISHRFSTVRKADKIAVMEGGTIVELGSHQELMAKGGVYHEMFTLQKEGFDGQ